MSSWHHKLKNAGCVVVIPTYNNCGTILKVVDEVSLYSSDIIVVNDGSTDQTDELLAKRESLIYIAYAKNRGKGYALQTGLKKATELGFRYAITIDADGQHYPDDIPLFIDEIERNPDSLLVGARNLSADNMPGKNTFANKFSNFWFKIETGISMADTQSGYRLYPLSRIRNMHFITPRYEFELEIIVKSAWRGIEVKNVPVKVFYPAADERVSHFRPLQDFTRISILNTFLVVAALLYYYPVKFFKALTWKNFKIFIHDHVTHSSDSNMQISLSVTLGIFFGIIPIWGYQMVAAGVAAHLFKLNKVIAIAASNISIPPMIPFILYGSVRMGELILDHPSRFTLSNISIDTIASSMYQYVLGSILLAIASSIALGVITLVVLNISGRNTK